MLLPAVASVREAARRTDCSNNLQNLGTASMTYQATHQKFPAASVWKDLNNDNIMDTTRASGSSFETFSGFVLLLPNLDANNIYDQFISAQGFNPNIDPIGVDAGVLSTVALAPLKCASAKGDENIGSEIEKIDFETSHYAMVNGVSGDTPDNDPTTLYPTTNTAFDASRNGTIGLSGAFGANPNANNLTELFSPGTGKTVSDFSDGASNTIAFGENSKADKGDYVGRRSGWAIGFVSGVRITPNGSIPGVNGTNAQLLDGVAVDGVLPNGRTIHVGIQGASPLNRSEVNLEGPFVDPVNKDTELFNNTSFSSNHTGGSQFAMADGSSRFVSESVDTQVLADVATINGSEIIDAGQLD